MTERRALPDGNSYQIGNKPDGKIMIPENRKVQLPELTISLLREDRSDAAVDDIAVPQCYGVNQTVLNCCLAAAFNAVIGGFSIGG